MTNRCKKHNKPLVREFHGKEFCLSCRNERKRDFYFDNPYPVFGKGKSRKQAQRHTYERGKQNAKS